MMLKKMLNLFSDEILIKNSVFRTFFRISHNGSRLGEVAEPEAKLEHRTLKLRTND